MNLEQIRRQQSVEAVTVEMDTDINDMDAMGVTGSLDTLSMEIDDDTTIVTAACGQLLRMLRRGESFQTAEQYVRDHVKSELQSSVFAATSQMLKLGY